jgi:AcrR family transcriptional regulator
VAERRTPASRADALLNRERILAAAHPAFAADPKVSLNTIAKLAGVGAGTLYRHFPTREDLILTVYRQEIRSLVDAAHEILGRYPPYEAFRVWLLRLAELARVRHGLGEALQAAAARQAVDAPGTPLGGAVSVLLRACEAAGEARPGIKPADVLLLMGFLWRVEAGEDGDQQARRVLDLALRGLR